VDTSLQPGERVVWEGQPIPGLMFGPGDIVAVPFSLLWGGFALFWNVSVWSDGAPFFFKLFGLPFLLAGIFLVAGRFWVDDYIRRHLYYRVTNQRVQILRTGAFPTIRSLDIHGLPSPELEERGNGRGNVRMGDRMPSTGKAGTGVWLPSLSRELRFFNIENPRAAFDAINQQRQAKD